MPSGDDKPFDLATGYNLFFAGMVCGGGALAAGLAIGAAGDLLVRAFAQNQQAFVPLLLVMIFAECIGLFAFIIAILMASKWK